jgi:hypothetical protein
MTTPKPSCTNWPDDLFTRTDPDSHAYARAVCERCPAIEWCRREVVEVSRPVGTWAGKLFSGRGIHRPLVSTCAVCGDEFLANHSSAKCRSEECRRKRATELQRESDRRRRPSKAAA